MTYNLTMVANNSGPVSFLQSVNSEIMLGMYGVLILFVLGTIMFISFIAATNNVNKSFAATSFILFGLSVILKALLLVPDLALFVTLIMAAVSIPLIKK